MAPLWKTLIDKLDGLTKIATTVGFAGLFVCVMMQIVWRYILEIPLLWSEEVARYLLVWISLLAVAIAFRNDTHIRLDFFVAKCPVSLRHFVWIFFNLLTLAFLALLLVYGIPNALLGKNTFSAGLSASFSGMTFTLFLPYLSVPVAAGIMILNLLDYIFHNLGSKEVGDVRDKVKP
jgi:TRAP-type C4-dicarboxylate transport system permease small subunit